MKKIVVICFILIVICVQAQTSFCFRAVRQDQYVYIPTGPRHLTCADLNNDSHLDVALVKENSPEITIFLGNGTGIYTTQVSYSQNAVQGQIISADFNGDGLMDLATVEPSSNLFRYFQGAGNGLLSNSVDYSVGLSPTALCSGDFNGDGDLDIAVANTGSNNISILLGNGTGSFTSITPQSIFQGSCNSMPTMVLSDDFDNDNLDDLVIVDGNSLSGYCHAIYLYLSNGNGTFNLSSVVSASAGARCAAIGDFNADGNKDLAATYFNASTGPPTNLSVYLGGGNGILNTVFSTTTQNMPISLHVGDLDGNSTQDIALVNTTSNLVTQYLNSGNGVMTNTVYYAVGDQPKNILIKDVNHDQAPDLLVLNSHSSHLTSIFGSNDGWYGTPRMYAINAGTQPYKTADFNLDGFDDIAFTGGAGSIPTGMAIVWGTSTNSILTAPQVFTTIGSPGLLTIADMNNDNRPDVITVDNFNKLFRIFQSVPVNSFTPLPATVFSSTMSVREICAGDFNGDNLPDLAVTCNGVNSVYVYHQQPAGTFSFSSLHSVGTGPRGMAIGDFNGDNRQDIAVCNFNSGDISILSNMYPAPFQLSNYTISLSTSCGPQQIVSGFFNSDNINDLALVSYNCGVHAFTGTLNGPLNFSGTFTTGSGPISLTSNDFDGDGIADLAVADYVYREFSIHKGLGNGAFSNGEMYHSGKAIDFISSGDFDGNGTKDLLLTMGNPALVLNKGVFSVALTSNTNNVCSGSAVTLSVSGQHQYIWSNGQSNNALTIYPVQTSTWSATAVNSSGCSSTSNNLVISVLPFVAPSMAVTSAKVCYDDGPFALNGNPPGGVYSGAVTSGSFIPFSLGSFTMMYTYTDMNNCSHSVNADLTVEECLGIDELQKNNWLVYPNPTQGVLTINCSVAGNIELYNLEGKLILKEANIGSQAKVDLSEFPAGIYLLKIESDGVIYKSKIIRY